jgi:hypothetical protein
MEEMPMITIMRTAACPPGKRGDALAFANQIAKYLNEKYSGSVEVLTPVGGNLDRIAWRLNYESLAQYEAYIGKFLADPDLVEMATKGLAIFLPGSINDDIWRTI